MARENVANFLNVLGKGAGIMAQSRMDREAKQIDLAREQSIAELNHGYRMDEQMAAQTADMTRYAATQAAEDRRAGERETHESQMASERYRRDDIDQLQTSQQQVTQRIETRIRTLTDDLNKENYFEGTPGYKAVMDELDQLEQQKVDVQASFMLKMRDLGVPGYKEQVESLLSRRTPAPTPATPGAPVADTNAAPAPTLEPPPPPVPAAPSYSSKGRKPAGRRGGGMPTHSVSTRAGAREMIDWGAAMSLTPPTGPGRTRPGRSIAQERGGSSDLIPRAGPFVP